MLQKILAAPLGGGGGGEEVVAGGVPVVGVSEPDGGEPPGGVPGEVLGDPETVTASFMPPVQ